MTEYTEQEMTVVADDGTPIEIKVQFSPIEPDEANRLFGLGQQVGDWGWKHQVWITSPEQVPQVQAAARFFYGWAAGSEKITVLSSTSIRYEAWYAA